MTKITTFFKNIWADLVDKRLWPIALVLVLVLATVIVVVNLVIDLSYAWLDPRIRYS